MESELLEQLKYPIGKAKIPEVITEIDIQKSSKIHNGSLSVSGIIKDANSRIVSAEYSIDGEGWNSVSARDLLFDSKVEAFDLTIKNLTKGDHFVIFRARDEEGNSGSVSLLK